MMEKFDQEKQAFELKKAEWVAKEVQHVQELIKKDEGRDLSGEELALLKQQLEDSFNDEPSNAEEDKPNSDQTI